MTILSPSLSEGAVKGNPLLILQHWGGVGQGHGIALKKPVTGDLRQLWKPWPIYDLR
jgi:hypothetical protein